MVALVALDILQVLDEEPFRKFIAEPLIQMAIEQAALLNEALGGPKPGGLPDSAGYPLGVLAALSGEVLSTEPPYESEPNRIY